MPELDLEPIEDEAPKLDLEPVLELEPVEEAPPPASAAAAAPVPKRSLMERIFGAQEESGYAMESGDMGPVLLRTSPETQAAYRKPAVTLPRVKLRQEDSLLRKIEGTKMNTLLGFAEGLTSPAGIEGALNPAIGAAQIVESVPQIADEVAEAQKTPAFSPERFQSAATVLSTLGMVAGGGAVGKMAGGRPRPPTLVERLFPETREASVAPETVAPAAAEAIAPETLAPERLAPKPEPTFETTTALAPDEIAATAAPETLTPEEVIPDASQVTETARVPEPEVRARVDEETPLRQQGEAAPEGAKETAVAAGEEIMSPGPGAASAKEPLASYEQRRFGKRFQEDQSISPEIREATGNRYYEPVPNKVTLADAERIIEQRGTDESLRLVRDEAVAMEPRVRATMGQGLIKKLNQSYREAQAAGDTARAQEFLNSTVETAEYLSELGTRLGQGVQSFAMWQRLTPEGTLLSARKAVGRAQERVKKIAPDTPPEKLPNLSPEAEAKILDLAKKVEEAPEGMPKDEASLQLNKFIARQKGFKFGDLPLGVYYGNILSGYNTHIVNSLDTFLNVVSEVNGLAATNPRAAARIYGGMIRGLGEGKLDAALALTEGRMATSGKWLEAPQLMEVAEFGKKGGVPIQETGPVSRAAKRLAESKIGYPLNAYKYVTRLLAASDAVMFRGAREARASLLAHRMAEAEGFKGDALLTRQREILGNPQMADFLEQAKREGFTGKKAKVRAAELRDLARPEELTSDAAEFAGEATYNHEPHGAIGFIAGSVAKVSNTLPVLKLFVPFTRIVANVTSRGLNYTPIGFKRAYAGYTGEGRLSPEARNLMLTRATVGTAGLVTLGTLQASGVLQIHGGGPSDPERRKQLQAAGWRPHTIQMGDDYFSYIYTPLGLGLSVVGNMTDAERYGELEQKDAATRAGYAVSRIPATVFSQSFLSGLSRLFNALSSNPGSSIAAVKQTLASTTGAFTNPALFRDLQRVFDPKAYRSETLVGDAIKNTPFASLALKPDLNAFGEPVKAHRQRFFGKLTDDPVWRAVIDMQLRVPVPNKSTELRKGEQITPDQYYDLLKTTGPQLKDWLRRNEKRLRQMTPEEAQDELSQASASIRKKALTRLR